jgi:hypothetical protein
MELQGSLDVMTQWIYWRYQRLGFYHDNAPFDDNMTEPMYGIAGAKLEETILE